MLSGLPCESHIAHIAHIARARGTVRVRLGACRTWHRSPAAPPAGIKASSLPSPRQGRDSSQEKKIQSFRGGRTAARFFCQWLRGPRIASFNPVVAPGLLPSILLSPQDCSLQPTSEQKISSCPVGRLSKVLASLPAEPRQPADMEARS